MKLVYFGDKQYGSIWFGDVVESISEHPFTGSSVEVVGGYKIPGHYLMDLNTYKRLVELRDSCDDWDE